MMKAIASKLQGKNETQTRVKTAIVGVTVLLLLVTVGGYVGASIVTAVLSAVMCWEFAQVIYISKDKLEKTKILLGASWLMVFVNIVAPKSGLETLMIAVICYFVFFLVTAKNHEEDLRTHFNELVSTNFVLIYVVLFMGFLPLLRKNPHGSSWVVLFFLINWTADSAAYFAGRKYGKQKLYPTISPGKSVEGAIGGIVGAVLISVIFKFTLFNAVGLFGAVITAVAVSSLSIVGDLCESMFKRAYRIKDSGSLLPGHGGMLDRFDGILFTLPIVYLCQKIFG